MEHLHSSQKPPATHWALLNKQLPRTLGFMLLYDVEVKKKKTQAFWFVGASSSFPASPSGLPADNPPAFYCVSDLSIWQPLVHHGGAVKVEGRKVEALSINMNFSFDGSYEILHLRRCWQSQGLRMSEGPRHKDRQWNNGKAHTHACTQETTHDSHLVCNALQ